MKTNPAERRERLLSVVEDGRRLAEFAADPIVQRFFETTRKGLLATLADPTKPFDALRDPVAMLRALNALEQTMTLRVDAGARADKTLAETD